MTSGFVDSLKLVLSDKYEISDSDYKKLSDILISQSLSDSAFDSGLVQMIYLMVHYKHRFPISLTFLKELWEYENISYNFVSMIGQLLKNKVISLRKVKKETFFKDSNITKSNTESNDADLYVVIYGSRVFNSVFDTFNEVLNRNTTGVFEGFNIGIPKNILDLVQKASRLLKNLDVKLEIESFTRDSVLGSSRLNLVLSQTSKYSYKDSDIQRVANKKIKKNNKSVIDVEAYIEGTSELFLGIDMSISAKDGLRSIPDDIYSFVEELEIEGV